MFLKDLKERLQVEEKTIKMETLGQVEKWTPKGTVWASVAAVSADSDTYRQLKTSDRENVSQLYEVKARALDRSWDFGAVRFLWTPTDGDPGTVLVLKPKGGLNHRGSGARRWVTMLVEDITDHSGDKKPK